MLYRICALICHQLGERTIWAGSMRLPLCARCTGIYGSIFIFFVYLLIRKRFKADYPPKSPLLIFAVCCLIPFMYDGGFSYLGIYSTDNLRRIITGAFAGLPLSFLAVFLLNLKKFMKNEKHEYIIKNILDISPLALSLIFAYSVYKGVLPWIIPAIMSFLGLASFFGILIFILGRAIHVKITKGKFKKLNDK